MNSLKEEMTKRNLLRESKQENRCFCVGVGVGVAGGISGGGAGGGGGSLVVVDAIIQYKTSSSPGVSLLSNCCCCWCRCRRLWFWCPL